MKDRLNRKLKIGDSVYIFLTRTIYFGNIIGFGRKNIKVNVTEKYKSMRCLVNFTRYFSSDKIIKDRY
jgi:hypothetical protein